eukprot:gene11777-8387_t
MSGRGSSSWGMPASYQWTVASVITLLAVFVFTVNILVSNYRSATAFTTTTTGTVTTSPRTTTSVAGAKDASSLWLLHGNATAASTTAATLLSAINTSPSSSSPPSSSTSSTTSTATDATGATSTATSTDQTIVYADDDPRLQFLFREYQHEILYSARGNYLEVPTPTTTAAADGGKQTNKFFKVAMEDNQRQFSLVEVDFCRATTLLHLYEMAQNDRVAITQLYPRFYEEKLAPVAQAAAGAAAGAAAATASKQKVLFDLSVEPATSYATQPQNANKGDVLIVYTTCNQLAMTVLSLQYLRNTDKVADIIVVDDHSTDGTVEYLRKKGFAVVSKPVATGLTDSWNIGYRLAVALGYTHVLFTNNDVLLTAGAVHLMHYGLKAHSLVVPLTTDKGAGHHKLQSIVKAHRLAANMGNVVDDYRNAELIQETLLRKYVYVPKEKRRCPAQQSVNEKNQPKFNGFCFAVNVDKIAPAAYEANVHLFDPKDRIVGQEDALTARMAQAQLYPILLHCSFVFHFKSRTVSAANLTVFAQVLARYNMTVVDTKSYPTVAIDYRPLGPASTAPPQRFSVDIRENLQWYHQAGATGAAAGAAAANRGAMDDETFVQSLIDSSNAHKRHAAAHNAMAADDRWVLDVYRSSGGLACRAPREEVLFPSLFTPPRAPAAASASASATAASATAASATASSSSEAAFVPTAAAAAAAASSPASSKLLAQAQALQRTYHRYPDMAFNIRGAPLCVYPSNWPDHCNRYLSTTETVFEPELYAMQKPSYIVIAIAMSDPVATPSAGDVFTAYELGQALQTVYSHVKIRYLRRGPAWYNPALLHDVDVLITLLDQYDLTQILGYYLDSSVPNYFEKQAFTCVKSYQLKPTLITVAWVRNWFHRWLSKPWFGNYDVVLTSSQLSQRFYETIGTTIGFAASCANGCPQKAKTSSASVSATSGTTASAGFVSPTLPEHHRPVKAAAPSAPAPAAAATVTMAPAVTSTTTTATVTTATPTATAPRRQLLRTGAATAAHDHHHRHDNATAHRRHLSNANGHGHGNANANAANMDAPGAKWQMFTPRVFTPSLVFPLATSLRYFRPSHSNGNGNDSPTDGGAAASAAAAAPAAAGAATGGDGAGGGGGGLSDALSVPTNASLQAAALFRGVDYVFTGSYFGTYRRIMDFDPAVLWPQYQGRIVGQRWDRANVSQGWKQSCTGLLPYEVVTEAYKHVKIVIDDANHVTFPWGSTNSRVFDATAAGALVLSNGEIGMHEIFGGVFRRHFADVVAAEQAKAKAKAKGAATATSDTAAAAAQAEALIAERLPIYRNAEDLTRLLRFYLTHDAARVALVREMQAHVLQHHSYVRRAETLGRWLEEQFRLTLHRRHSSGGGGGSQRRRLWDALNDDEAAQRTDGAGCVHRSANGATPPPPPPPPPHRSGSSDRHSDSASSGSSDGSVEDYAALLPESSAAAGDAEATTTKPPAHSKATAATAAAGTNRTDTAKPKGNRAAAKAAAAAAASAAVASAPLPAPSASTAAPGGANRGSGLCIGVRTTENHEEWLPIFVRSLIVQHSKSKYRQQLPLQIFLIDTEAKASFAPSLIDLVNKHNERFKYPYLQVVWSQQVQPAGVRNTVYGYDDTDKLLELMLTMRRLPLSTRVLDGVDEHAQYPGKHAALTSPLPTCEWVMFSNGDNMYNAAWFNTVAPLALSDAYDVLGWDFVTHHPRNGTNNTPIRVAFERKFVDLASVMIRAELFGKTNSRFLSEAVFTRDMFARDFVTIESLLASTTVERTHLIHQCLLMHQ